MKKGKSYKSHKKRREGEYQRRKSRKEKRRLTLRQLFASFSAARVSHSHVRTKRGFSRPAPRSACILLTLPRRRRTIETFAILNSAWHQKFLFYYPRNVDYVVGICSTNGREKRSGQLWVNYAHTLSFSVEGRNAASWNGGSCRFGLLAGRLSD